MIEVFNQKPTNKDQQQNCINIFYFVIENDFLDIELKAGVFEQADKIELKNKIGLILILNLN